MRSRRTRGSSNRRLIRDIVIQGAELTSESLIRKRIALKAGRPYRLSDVRKTQENFARFSKNFRSISAAMTPR